MDSRVLQCLRESISCFRRSATVTTERKHRNTHYIECKGYKEDPIQLVHLNSFTIHTKHHVCILSNFPKPEIRTPQTSVCVCVYGVLLTSYLSSRTATFQRRRVQRWLHHGTDWDRTRRRAPASRDLMLQGRRRADCNRAGSQLQWEDGILDNGHPKIKTW